jgi:hypothetical protein
MNRAKKVSPWTVRGSHSCKPRNNERRPPFLRQSDHPTLPHSPPSKPIPYSRHLDFLMVPAYLPVVALTSLKMKASRSSEMLVSYSNTTQHHNQEDLNLNHIVLLPFPRSFP